MSETKLYDEQQGVEVTVNNDQMKVDSLNNLEALYKEHTELVQSVFDKIDALTSAKLKTIVKGLLLHPVSLPDRQTLSGDAKKVFDAVVRSKQIYLEQFINSSFLETEDVNKMVNEKTQEIKHE